MNEQPMWKQKFPQLLTTFLVFVSLYLFGWTWTKTISIIKSEYEQETIIYGSFLFGKSQNIPMIMVAVVSVVCIFTWLLSTRVKFYQTKPMRIVVFFLSVLSIWAALASYGMGQSRTRFIPFFQERLSNVIETDGFFESIVFEQTHGFFLMLTMTPLFVMFFITLFMVTRYARHDKELNESFFQYQWNGRWLQRFSKMEETVRMPDLELGIDSKTKELVVLPGGDRTLNTTIVGSIGTGKTAALGLPMLKQDLDHMVNYINNYPILYERDDFNTEDVGGRYLSGISVIDPSNDLCQKTLLLVKAHGIPDEAITYINPLDPDTPSINAMRGPVDKVAEVFALVIAGLNDSKDGGNFFFEQAQRNHLKHYIYLLKLHDPNKDVILDMLLDMYNNPQLVRKMHEQLKKTFPSNYEHFENRDERNYWKIVQGIDEWFDMNLLPKTTRVGPATIPVLDDDGKPTYYDAKEEHVVGLRNILNDIGANLLIRRVLFGHSDFDFDRHMAIGGVLLVNTAKGELVNLARVLGKIVLMNLQNATFRRPPQVSSFHHILIDEAPDYLYNAFREFPAQSRKYKVSITTLQQTIAQLADQFGEMYMTTILGTMRNRMVYGDVPTFDAEYFSKMFGEKFVYEEGQSEMSVSPLQEDPMSRSGSSYSKVREQSMTGGDIMFQEAFQCAVKLVVHNKPMPVVQIAANFVPKEEFIEAKFKAGEDALKIWLRERRLYGTKPGDKNALDIVSVEETEQIMEQKEQEYLREEQNFVSEFDSASVARALEHVVEPNPRDGVVYQRSGSVVPPVPTPTVNTHTHENNVGAMIDMMPTPVAQVSIRTESSEEVGHVDIRAEELPVAAAPTETSGLSDLFTVWTDDEVAAPVRQRIVENSIETSNEEGLHTNAYKVSELSEANNAFMEKLGESINEK